MILSDPLMRAFKNTPLGQSLSPEEMDVIISFSKVISFSPGDVIQIQGRKTHGTYLILDGNAIVSGKVLGEGRVELGNLGMGNFIGEISLIERNPSTASIVAVTPMECIFLERSVFEVLAQFYPELHFKINQCITKTICKRVAEMQAKIIEKLNSYSMMPNPILNEMLNTSLRPKPISYEDAGVPKEKLRQYDVFDDLDKQELQVLLEMGELIQVPKCCSLIKPGDTDQVVYVILRGAIQTSIVSQNVYAKLAVLGPIRLFAPISTIDGRPAIFNYASCETAILLKLSAEKINKIEDKHLSLWQKTFGHISRSMAGMKQALNKLDIRLHSEFYNR